MRNTIKKEIEKSKAEEKLLSGESLSIDELLALLPNPTVLIKVKKVFEKVNEEYDELFNIISFKVEYIIWKVWIGEKSFIYIKTEPRKHLYQGQEVFLKPLSLQEVDNLLNDKDVLNFFIRDLGLSKKKEKNMKKSVKKLIKIYEVTEEIPEDLWNYIAKDVSLKEVWKRCIPEEVLDERLYHYYRSLLVNFSRFPRRKWQRYQNHGLLITNTKIGKTSFAIYLFGEENVYDSGRSSRLLGYSDASSSYPSDLDGKVDPTILDEITSSKYEPLIFDALPNLLELGYAQIGKGCKSIKVRTITSFAFLTNTGKKTKSNNSRIFLEDFEQFLLKFTESSQRIGSRLSIILFGNDFKEIEGSFDIDERLLWLWRLICRKITENVNKLLEKKREIIDWLNEKIPYYDEQIDILLERISSDTVRSFWEGQKYAYRHINGLAFKLAILDYTLEHQEWLLYIDSMDLEKLRELYNYWRFWVVQQNLNSLRKMVEWLPDEDKYLKLKFESLPARYYKLFLKTIILWYNEQENLQDKVPIEILSEYYKKVKKKEDVGWYETFKRVVDSVSKNIDKANKILEIFGLRLIMKDLNTEELILEISNKYRFEKFAKIVSTSTSPTANTASSASARGAKDATSIKRPFFMRLEKPFEGICSYCGNEALLEWMDQHGYFLCNVCKMEEEKKYEKNNNK